MNKAVFLDRDGIIVRPVNDEAPTNPLEMKLIPEIIPVIRQLKQSGFLVIVVSNQPDIALGIIDRKTKGLLEAKFITLLNKNRIAVDRVYYCHHHPNGTNSKYAKVCKCQKPKPGMLLAAIKSYRINPAESFMLGDRASDIKAGKSAGVNTILFDPLRKQSDYLKQHDVRPDFKVNSLKEITGIVNSGIALILAAGSGTRMLPLTKKIPKPLVKINNKPMIWYILKLLRSHNFNRIGINIFHLKSLMKEYLIKQKLFSIKIIEEYKLSGTAGAVREIAQVLKPDRPFLVISSDMMVNFDLGEIYNFHLKHKAFLTICCYFRLRSEIIVKKSGLVLFDKKTHRLLKFEERPETESPVKSGWVNSSVYVFNPEVIKLIPKNETVDIAKDLIPLLFKSNKRIYAYPVNRKKFYQLGIDTVDRIKQVENDIRTGKLKV